MFDEPAQFDHWQDKADYELWLAEFRCLAGSELSVWCDGYNFDLRDLYLDGMAPMDAYCAAKDERELGQFNF